MQDPARMIEEQNTQKRARLLNIDYFDTSTLQQRQLYDLIPVQELYALRVIPLQIVEGNLTIGITTNTSQVTMDDLHRRFSDYRTTFVLISDTGYKEFMRLYDPPKKIEYQDISLTTFDETNILQISQALSQIRADDMLAYLVQQAFKLRASDIHLETTQNGARVRFRVHGVLHPVAQLTSEKYRQLMSALASAANVSTSADEDQTGHINRTYRLATGDEVTVNLRVETVPAVNGIDAVLRLFNFKSDMLDITKLQLTQDHLAVMQDVISKPSGLVLIVGPTGSGKTTTLYSLLNALNSPERKIITLEDPVEYQIEGITQIPVKSRDGESFAEKFRAVMRLDPDVIMVGEIRDIDTAKTALQAALTGHLVLSTYHASSAAAALTRLLDAIGENPLYSSAIRLIQAQRLIRKLDQQTKQPYLPEEHIQQLVEKIVENLPQHRRPELGDNVKLYHPQPSADNPFGYEGQIAIREMLTMTPALQQLLRKPTREITTEDIEQVAMKDGMITLLEDGVVRALAGETSIEEVFRVIG